MNTKIKKKSTRAKKFTWKRKTVREEIEKIVRETTFYPIKKNRKRPKNAFTHTFDFHAEKKKTLDYGEGSDGGGMDQT